MSTIEVKFLNAEDSNSILGEEISTGIDVRELPHDPEGQNIFIRREFTSNSVKYWKVEGISSEHNTDEKTIACEITLSPLSYLPISISEKHSSNGSKLMRGRILECDFGYFSQDISVGAELSTTVSNFNGKLPFEMVKRRLVVVVSNKEDPALVVPISKGNKAKDKRTVVEITSLPTDLVTFNSPVCYAKTAAISYVSGHRLFPVRYHMPDGTRRYDNRVEKKLSNDDVVSIKKAVFIAIGGHNILQSILDKDNEIATLEDNISLKNNEIGCLKVENAELMDMLDKYTE